MHVLIRAVAIGAVGAAVSCGDPTDAQIEGTMAAEIVEAGPWNARKSLSATLVNRTLTITGVENRLLVSLKIFDAGVGSFHAVSGETVPQVEARFSDERTFSYSTINSGSVTVTITEFTDSRVVGTFDFVAFALIADANALPHYHFANGHFNIPIQ